MATDYKIRKPFDRVTKEDLLEDVNQAGSLHMTGDVIPSRWWQIPELQYESGKPNPIAIMILAHLVYWYRPGEYADDTTGKRYSKPKITESNVLRKSYEDLANHFGFTKREIQNACHFLRDRDILEIHIAPKVQLQNGFIAYNVTYLRLNLPVISQFTNVVEDGSGQKNHKEPELKIELEDTEKLTTKGKTKEPELSPALQELKEEVGGQYFNAIMKDRPKRLEEWANEPILEYWHAYKGDTGEHYPLEFARTIDKINKRFSSKNETKPEEPEKPETSKSPRYDEKKLYYFVLENDRQPKDVEELEKYWRKIVTEEHREGNYEFR